jgi:hypothetical protein
MGISQLRGIDEESVAQERALGYRDGEVKVSCTASSIFHIRKVTA